MSIFKTLLVLAVVVAAVSAGKHHARGRAFKGKGRAVEVAAAAAAPETKDATKDVKEALGDAAKATDTLAAPEALSAHEAANASAIIQDSLKDAIVAAADSPHAQAVQPEIVAAKVADTHADLEHHIEEAKDLTKELKTEGTDMKPEEAAEKHKDLQEHLDLALHAAEQNDKAVQQEKAIEEGAPAAEVAAIPAAVSSGAAPVAATKAGRKFKGRRG